MGHEHKFDVEMGSYGNCELIYQRCIDKDCYAVRITWSWWKKEGDKWVKKSTSKVVEDPIPEQGKQLSLT